MIARLVFGRVGNGGGIRLLQKSVHSSRYWVIGLVKERNDILYTCLYHLLERHT